MIKLFENYNEIAAICNRYDIKKWTLNRDGRIDVDGTVWLYNMNFTKLPLKFGRVTGYFMCHVNALTSLEGAPSWVGGDFDCRANNLTTLDGAPSWVGGGFYCSNNKLTTIEAAPKHVGQDFYCHSNYLTNLKGVPREVGGDFLCYNNNLTTLEGAPREVGGYFNCGDNNLPKYFTLFMELNKREEQPILKEILKWQDEYELWKDPEKFKEKFKWMMEDIQENDLPDIKIRFPR